MTNSMLWRRLFLAAACVFAANLASAQEPPKDGASVEKTVRLTIDYGDGVKKEFTAIPWKEKLTVFDALQAAAKHPRGVQFKHRGKDATVLVTAIDDLTNQSGGKNWLYEVNGTLGDRSCAVFEVQPGDTLLWKFANNR
ncbi:hypothetical protein ETAA8_12150 [Anatilimnocola aggregata]|uniref:Transcobalamin-like C-terminal domain-containing protein n=1 Tax=Anatilimnocola aggregata TaxID=2528021 RepID=A0A517Y7C9_9BACT|nr:DUF4430 domain-containing protein [Anatilimnocola aggregata]QDU26141.1 hypothetical protein ETAA8_12150 [Anatilimnocola aggregata]